MLTTEIQCIAVLLYEGKRMQATWEVKKIIKNKDKEKREPSCTVGGNVN